MKSLAANLVWWGSCVPEWFRFRQALTDVEACQRQALLSILQGHRFSDFGRRHGFERLTTAEEFQSAVPLDSEEALSEEIERLAETGRSGRVDEAVLLLEPTSGSTGPSRLIPYTASLKAQFQRAVGAWVADLFWRRPGLMNGRAYWSLSPPVAARRHGRMKVGFEHDAEYLSPLARWLSGCVCLDTRAEEERFWEHTCQVLLQARDLRLISVWSPSFLLVLVERIQELWHTLPTRPEQQRAEPATWWPDLGLISCWADAQSSAPAAQLQDRFPGVEIQPKGLLATEGVVTLPLGGRRPLALRSHFFEFEDQAGRHLLAHQLGQGESYRVLLTTGGGLYRYPLGDRVQVDGFLGQCPTFVFLGRDSVVDHRGEKLHQSEVGRLLHEIPGFAMLAYEDEGYVLFSESGSTAQGQRLEEALCANFHYALCRQLGQLRPLRVFRVVDGPGTYHRVCERQQRSGDIKLQPLHPGQFWSKEFEGEWLRPS